MTMPEARRCKNCKRLFTRPLSKDPVFCDQACAREDLYGTWQICKRVGCDRRFQLKNSERTGAKRKYCTLGCQVLDQKSKNRNPAGRKIAQKAAVTDWSRRIRSRDRQCQFRNWVEEHRHLITDDEFEQIEYAMYLHCAGLTAHHRAKKSTFPELVTEDQIGIAICHNHHIPVIHNPNLQPIMFKLKLLLRREDVLGVYL